MPVVHTAVTGEPIDLASHLALVENPQAGAVASFLGTIRDHDPEADGEVVGIDYSHHPDADRILAELAAEVSERLDLAGDARVAVSHRVGHLGVGDVALVCCVATSHRAESFAICSTLVEEIKARLPIWKHQTEASGRRVWSRLRPAEGAE